MEYIRNSNIKSFSIEGLFGTRNVIIPFENNIKVLIGENGLGKTTILNILYYTLKGKFSRLNSFDFKKVIVEFHSSKVVSIDKEDLVLLGEEERFKFRHDSRVADQLSLLLSENETREIVDILNAQEEDEHSKKKLVLIIERLSRQIGYPSGVIKRAIFSLFGGKLGRLEEMKSTISKELNAEILYFPTYRRIEEELHILGTGDNVKLAHDDKRLIQFGMEDVRGTFNKVIESIKNTAILGFSAITGEMLSQYLEGTPKLDQNISELINADILKIILERVGENISKQDKERIMVLVSSKEIFEKTDYKYLLNFLSKLIKIYDQQKNIDNNIKTFESVCNTYLTGKKIIYNESKVTINVFQQRNDEAIDLRNLSSGEKQIISLFAKIYLENPSNLIVLFDEPELSLSIEWQKQLLPDILKSNKCNLLLTVTHSPFIFDNELDVYAEDMNKYCSEII